MFTTPVLIAIAAALLLALLVLLTLLAVRKLGQGLGSDAIATLERNLRDEGARARAEALEQSRQQRVELSASLLQFGQTLATQQDQLGRALAAQLETFGRQLEALSQRIDERQLGMQKDARDGRVEQDATLQRFGEALVLRLTAIGETSTQRLAELRSTVDERLKELQADNAVKLEEMRKTVDEKLHNTLEERLGQSFKLVSERLELVQRGLGEMQSLAAGVGDLKRVLTNV
ncbi:MAG: recombinase RmuC [Nevskia sp.]|nr:recombinase RmuC [Nevskia sp.]